MHDLTNFFSEISFARFDASVDLLKQVHVDLQIVERSGAAASIIRHTHAQLPNVQSIFLKAVESGYQAGPVPRSNRDCRLGRSRR